jgi:hypothetical protein
MPLHESQIADVDDLIDDMDLRGTIQLASFHPEYLFAGESALHSSTNR